jgi:ribosomal protein L2
MRKDAGMQVSDRIYINVSSEGASIIESTKQNDELIRGETLGLKKIRIGQAIPNVEIERSATIEGEEVMIQIGRDS